MQFVAPEIIKAGEKGLFSSMLSSFDEFQVEKLFQNTNLLLLKEKMQFKKGKILVYNNQIAYKFDFRSFAIFSLLVDEKGKILGFTDPTGYRPSNGIETESYGEIIDPEIIKKRKVELLDSLSVTISNRTINELFKENYKIETVGKMIYKQGDIVVFYDHVTYQFDYEVEVIFSILIDQEGNFINTPKENNGSTL